MLSHSHFNKIVLFVFFIFFSGTNNSSEAAPQEPLKLTTAVMCENILERQPKTKAVVFSIGKGEVYCYTAFDNVSEKTSITHNWYNRDHLSTKIKLQLQPPRWATYSTIQLRESDKGPWRIEITNSEEKVIHVLRFSITD